MLPKARHVSGKVCIVEFRIARDEKGFFDSNIQSLINGSSRSLYLLVGVPEGKEG